MGAPSSCLIRWAIASDNTIKRLEKDLYLKNIPRIHDLEDSVLELRQTLKRLITFLRENWAKYCCGNCGCADLAQDGRRCPFHTEMDIARIVLEKQEKSLDKIKA